MKAGFIGLGSMGAPIARRLARCGFEVTGCDVSPAMLEAFDEPGSARCADPLETARSSELLGICVRTDAQLEALADGGKLYEALGQGGVVILHSTVAPELAVRQAELAAQHGVGFVDVGVSGGGPAAIEGQLSLFIGASDADVTKAKPWLEAISKAMAHLGPVGRGQQAKLLNNLISIANYGMSAAIIDIGCDMGFDRQQLVDAFMAGSAQSFALRVAPGFIAPGRDHMDLHDLLRKDVDHARALPTSEVAARDGLVAASEVLLARLRRAAGKTVRSGRETVEAYVAAVRARDLDGFVTLFADRATYTVPNGKTMTGPAEIREFQAMVFSAGQPSPTPLEWFVAPEGVAVEIEAKLPDGSVRLTTNHYRFDGEGKIVSLRVFARQ
ncbi:NAD(P)-binding domain-containing protein [Novosphingobium sp.]|uniref:NAD(P)-binding domain-containing protein n=1 Tax=Novosphingobium sp. TaxID=1874826 RepID=UPI00286E9AF7|nr:NAD(P)-binding domain-containing protein [Novosphingobium sp.]